MFPHKELPRVVTKHKQPHLTRQSFQATRKAPALPAEPHQVMPQIGAR